LLPGPSSASATAFSNLPTVNTTVINCKQGAGGGGGILTSWQTLRGEKKDGERREEGRKTIDSKSWLG
jgi:hypothetical protein